MDLKKLVFDEIKDIEKNILGARSREFVKTARQELYEKSVKNGKLKRYEK